MLASQRALLAIPPEVADLNAAAADDDGFVAALTRVAG